MSDDMTLVRAYAQGHSEEAFAALVSRHINLVYSVALRQVRDTHLAEEITQSVFIVLAQKANSLSPSTILSGWLCRTARYISSETLRKQRRRQMREQEAHMQSIPSQAKPDTWMHISPLLEDALNSLGQTDHDAVILRFFEGKELKEVGVLLGLQEDAARMRVNRAVEKLRKFFSKKGIILSAGAMTAAITANSVQSAPAGLVATTISTAISGSVATATATITATKIIAMSALQKMLMGGAVAILVGAVIYQSRQMSQLRSQIKTIRQQQAPLVAQIEQLTRERDNTTNRLTSGTVSQTDLDELLKLRNEVTQLRTQTNELTQVKAKSVQDETKSKMDAAESLIDRIRLLKKRLAQTPGARIPELQYLTEENWIRGAAVPLVSDEDFRSAFSYLRQEGESNFIYITESALRKYLESNNNQFPADLSQLKPYFTNPPGDDVLQRYQIVPGNSVPAANAMQDAGDWIITLKDPTDGSNWALGRTGVATFSSSDDMAILAPAMRALSDDTPIVNGKKHLDIHSLGPYLKTPEQQAAYQRLMQK